MVSMGRNRFLNQVIVLTLAKVDLPKKKKKISLKLILGPHKGGGSSKKKGRDFIFQPKAICPPQ